MWKEFFKFDLEYQLRQPLLWICALFMALMAFGATTSDAITVGGSIGNINRNAPIVIAKLLEAFSLVSMFIVTIFIAGAVLRDSEIGISDMLFATPMRKRDYLVGRFGAGMVACMFIFLVIIFRFIPLGLWIQALTSGVRVSFLTLFGMRFRKVNPSVIVLPLTGLPHATSKKMNGASTNRAKRVRT